MAIKNLIAKGIGFNPGSISFIPTHGFESGAAIASVIGRFVAAQVTETKNIVSQVTETKNIQAAEIG